VGEQVSMDMKQLGGGDRWKGMVGRVGRKGRGIYKLNELKYRIICIILKFTEYLPHLFMFVNIIYFKCVKVLFFGLYFNDFKTINIFGSFMAFGKYVI
jgi:hypothetical protein